MKHNLRNRVLLLLKLVLTGTDKYELFNQAFELYKETPEKSPAVEVKLNRVGFTDTGLENLLYDLQKIHNISDTEIHTASSPEELKNEEIKIAVSEVVKLQSAKRPNKKAIATAQAVVDDLKAELEVLLSPEPEEEEKDEAPVFPLVPAELTPLQLKEKELEMAEESFKALDSAEPQDLVALSEAEARISNIEIELSILKANPVPQDDQISSDSIEVVEMPSEPQHIGASLRSEFPFLNDPNCPEVLFVVVGKKVAAYHRHQELHAKLQEALDGTIQLSEEDQKQLASDTQEAFAENRALWDELNYYGEHKEILGKHPLFRETVAKREVDSMTTDQLAKYRSSSAKFLSEKRKALKDPKLSADKKAKLEEAIADREYRLGLVNTKLGADGAK